MSQTAPAPKRITLHQKSRVLELFYDSPEGEQCYPLSAEYLRVLSPSAEVRGHGQGQEVLQTGKKQVAINSVSMAGNYALHIIFDDGHDSGIYSWNYLYQLATEQEQRWQSYLQQLQDAGASRDPDTQVLHFDPSPAKHQH